MAKMAGILELRARLSAFLRRVRAGGSVVITEQGQPIGQNVPYGEGVEEEAEGLDGEELVAWSGKALAAQTPIARARGKRTVAELLVEGRL